MEFKVVAMLILWVVYLALVLVHGAPSRDPFDLDTQEDRWLADGTFYDYEYVADQPQADAYGVPVSNNLCPPVPKRLPSGGCDVTACSSDRECEGRQLKCCYNGCVYTCLPEVRPPPHFDWIREPVRRLQFGQSWLIQGPNKIVDVEMCTTTRPKDDDSDPLVCPHGYECSIDDVGDPARGIPNRGHCVKIVDDVTTHSVKSNKDPKRSDQDEGRMADDPREDMASLHACDIGNNQLLLTGHSIVVDGKDCLCYEKRLVCDG